MRSRAPGLDRPRDPDHLQVDRRLVDLLVSAISQKSEAERVEADDGRLVVRAAHIDATFRGEVFGMRGLAKLVDQLCAAREACAVMLQTQRLNDNRQALRSLTS